MLKVAVMGCGIVGSGVIRMLTGNAGAVERAVGAEVRLTHALDVRPVELPEGVRRTADFEDLLAMKDLSIAVEAIGGCGVAYAFTKRLLEKGISVISSNKELVSEHGDELIALAAERKAQYLFEAAVGGGVPILRPLRTCLAGNRIQKIEGVVNGSTNYLLTRMEEAGLGFPAALAEAKELGYVEAEPSADIEGWDARRKLNILANAAFGSRLSDGCRIPTEGIARVTEDDLDCAHRMGGTIKLVAHARLEGGAWRGWVHPALVMPEHPLFRVRDVFNGIVVTGDFVGDVLFQGRGAGSLPTASAIVGDIIEAARGVKRRPRPDRDWDAPAFAAPDGEPAKLMLRLADAGTDEPVPAIEAMLPGASLKSLGGMRVLTTPVLPYGQLMERIGRLHGEGVRTGIPIRVLR